MREINYYVTYIRDYISGPVVSHTNVIIRYEDSNEIGRPIRVIPELIAMQENTTEDKIHVLNFWKVYNKALIDPKV